MEQGFSKGRLSYNGAGMLVMRGPADGQKRNGCNDGEHERPDADPYVTPHDLDERIGKNRLIARAGNRAVSGQIALTVPFEIQPSDATATSHRILPDPGVYRALLPHDVARKPHVPLCAYTTSNSVGSPTIPHAADSTI